MRLDLKVIVISKMMNGRKMLNLLKEFPINNSGKIIIISLSLVQKNTMRTNTMIFSFEERERAAIPILLASQPL